MTGEREVDVVVVSWNTREELLRCLASVEGSTSVRPRVAVVDNASTDGSADAVRASFPDAELVENAANEGFARAVNRGLRCGSASYVLLLNPDAELPPGAVAALARRLDTLPRHAVVAPRLVWDGGAAQHSAYGFPSIPVSVLLATGLAPAVPRRVRARLLLEGAWGSDRERDVPWVIGAAMLVRRAALDEVGALDERFFVYAEDMELCDRLGRAGWLVRFTPDVTVLHRGNRSGAQRYGEDRTAVHLASATAWLRRRHGRAWTSAWLAVNAAGTVPRWAASAALARSRPTPPRLARAAMWRAHARFYLGTARNPDRGP
ncbi:MAG TPA: glycosyltransferase family 2 protein [Candidatus Dormibacteraeota bacterium]|nr:glycosyltransferase family 2 protein [Candidatus Dormibacteraeota bacterium]